MDHLAQELSLTRKGNVYVGRIFQHVILLSRNRKELFFVLQLDETISRDDLVSFEIEYNINMSLVEFPSVVKIVIPFEKVSCQKKYIFDCIHYLEKQKYLFKINSELTTFNATDQFDLKRNLEKEQNQTENRKALFHAYLFGLIGTLPVLFLLFCTGHIVSIGFISIPIFSYIGYNLISKQLTFKIHSLILINSSLFIILENFLLKYLEQSKYSFITYCTKAFTYFALDAIIFLLCLLLCLFITYLIIQNHKHNQR